MPITYWTLLIGAISARRHPGLRRLLLQGRDHRGGAPVAARRGICSPTCCVLSCVFVTATYTLPAGVHGVPRQAALRRPHHPPHESPRGGHGAADAAGDPFDRRRAGSSAPWCSAITSATPCRSLGGGVPRPRASYMAHGFTAAPFWLALAGIVTAWYLYIKRPDLPGASRMELGPLYALVERKYGFDELNAWLFAGGARSLGTGFWRGGDQAVIDGLMVNGSARVVGWFSGVMRLLQTGCIYQYAFTMLIGVLGARSVWLPGASRCCPLARHLGPDPRRRAGACARRRPQRAARALDRARRRRSLGFLVTIPLWTRLRLARAPACSSSSSRRGSSASTSTTTSASTASRCCSSC